MYCVCKHSWTNTRIATTLQLLKLACGHLVTTPFYLITDADTFYLNPFSAGRAPPAAAAS